MPLVIVVVVVLIAFFVWRARTTRRLTVEESVDRYRRTLGAVQNAAARAHPEGGEQRASAHEPRPRRSNRTPALASRGSLVVVALAAVTIIVVVVVVATHHRTPKHSASPTTVTTPRRAPRPTTTTRPAPTTTTPPLVQPAGAANTFNVSKASYTIVVQATTAACWVDMRDPGGTALFTGTLSATESQSVTASAVTIRLGNPAAVTLSIDGTPVPFTIPSGSPATLHFQSSTAPA